jgi:hypothetical protein
VRFPVVDRFINGDDDLNSWKAGIDALSSLGLNGISVRTYAVLQCVIEMERPHMQARDYHSPAHSAWPSACAAMTTRATHIGQPRAVTL